MLSLLKSEVRFECFKLLVKNGANVQVKNLIGDNMVHIASLRWYVEAVQFLLNNYDFDLSITNNEGFTAIDTCKKGAPMEN
jgi:ankyrin repeat protein